MNENTERLTAAIGGMLMAFPSSASNIRDATVSAYLMAVDEIPAAAVVMACKAFIQGKVDDWNADFAPSAPRLAKEAKAIQERMQIEAFWSKTEFVAVGSPKWRALEKSRGRSMPVVERDGVSGWYVAKDEVAAIPAQMLIEDGNERVFAVPELGRMG